jgi:hypothetical protein
LRFRTRFRRYGGRRVPFSCFTLPDSFSVASGVAGPFFMFCASRLISGGTGCHVSRFHVLRSCTHFRRYRRCRVPFSFFELPESFPAIPRASEPVFMFCSPGLIFDGIEGDGSHFRGYRRRRVPFSCFALPDSFSAVPRTLCPVFMFCAHTLFSGGTEGV